MTKKSFILRNVATVVACLVACLVMSCGGGSGRKNTTVESENNTTEVVESKGSSNGGNNEMPADSKVIEKIQSLMQGAGYRSSTVITNKDVLFGAAAGLMYTNTNLGMLQIYFYPSNSAAAAGKSSVWDQSAKDLELVCKINESFVYIGSKEFVAVLDGLLR